MAPLILPPPPCPDSKIPRPCSPFALCKLPAVSFCGELHRGRRDKILKFLFAAVEERAQFFACPLSGLDALEAVCCLIAIPSVFGLMKRLGQRAALQDCPRVD